MIFLHKILSIKLKVKILSKTIQEFSVISFLKVRGVLGKNLSRVLASGPMHS